jgi:hypothetical protein
MRGCRRPIPEVNFTSKFCVVAGSLGFGATATAWSVTVDWSGAESNTPNGNSSASTIPVTDPK